MSKKCCKVTGIVIAIIALVVVAYAIYGFCCRVSIPEDATAAEQVKVILEKNNCYVCHAQEPNLPFYASFPGMKKTFAKHTANAYHATDLKSVSELLSEISEPELAKIEHIAIMKNMPIKQYTMVHWGTGLNDKESAILIDWAAQVRAERFANGLAAAEFANEPIAPIPSEVATDPAKVALGYKMYNDKRLSQDGTIDCAYCHILKSGGASKADYRTSEGIAGQFGGVNAPTVFNAYFNVQQFWNGRAADLAAQAAGPPVNPVEMGDWTWDDIVAGLATDKALVKEFEALYPDGLTADNVCNAIQEFEKTLLTPNAPFDQYLKGNKDAVSNAVIFGYAEFKEHNCSSCHVGQLIGGQSFEYLGINKDYFADRNPEITCGADDDGLAGFTGNMADMKKFKVPTLRNVTMTPPYFHDGSKATLEDAVSAMVEYQTNAPIHGDVVSAICTFLGSLTGESPYFEE